MMTLSAIYANVSVGELGRSQDWFTRLLGRTPDAAPMPGLIEWHHAEAAGLQLHVDPDKAGRSVLTLIVPDIREWHRRLAAVGLEPGEVEAADKTTILRLRDPDGNLVVLAQPGRA